jgi:hypothetical protein
MISLIGEGSPSFTAAWLHKSAKVRVGIGPRRHACRRSRIGRIARRRGIAERREFVVLFSAEVAAGALAAPVAAGEVAEGVGVADDVPVPRSALSTGKPGKGSGRVTPTFMRHRPSLVLPLVDA